MKTLRLLAFASFVAVISGCATAKIHTVYMGMPGDPNDFELLAYDYMGRFKYPYPGLGEEPEPQKGALFTVIVPEVEYVDLTWRVKSTRKTYRDRVDLRGLIPPSLNDVLVHPVIDGSKLSIFLLNEKEKLPQLDPKCPSYHGRIRCEVIYFKDMEKK